MFKKLALSFCFLFATAFSFSQTLDATYFNSLKTTKATSTTDLIWTQVGPGNSGYCDWYFIHPTDDKVMFMSPDMDNSYVTPDDGESWQTIKDNDGDGDLLREITAMDFSRQDANLGFCVDVRGRLLKTTDKGKNWTKITAFPATSRQSSMAVDPSNDAIWYIGGGDFFNVKDNHRTQAMMDNRDLSFQYAYAEYGNIYKTTNKGVSWTKISGTASGLPTKVNIGKILINPNTTSTIVIATSHGVLRSINSGTTWTSSATGLPNDMPRDMVSRIENGVYTLYCLEQTKYVPNGTTMQSIGGLYKSIDGGLNWTNTTGDLGINLAVVNNYNSTTKYYNTIAAWLGITSAVAKSTYPTLPTSIIPVFNRLAVDPRNSTRIYVAHNTKHDTSFGPGDIWSSDNSGINWKPVMRTGSYWKNNSNTSYWNAKGSTGTNATFAHIQAERDRNEEYSGNRFLTVDSRGYVYGSVDQQTFRSTNEGLNWQQRDDISVSGGAWMGRGDSNLPGRSIIMNTGIVGKYLFLCGEHGLWQTFDPANPTQVKQIEGQVNVSGATSIATAAVHPNNPNIIYTMQFRQDHRGWLRKSIDGGATWNNISNVLPSTDSASNISDNILHHSLTIDYSNPSSMYFHTLGTPINEVYGSNAPFSNHGFYKSTNDGVNWTVMNGSGTNLLPANGTTINRIKIDPTTPTIIYAACVQNADKTIDGGLYKSTDAGVNWIKMTIPTTIKAVNNIFIRKNTSTPNELYISCGTFEGLANGGGVWKSIDNGLTWYKIFDLPYVWQTEISAVNPNIITVAAGAQNVKISSLNVLNPGAYISFDGGNTWMKANKNLGQPHNIVELKPDLTDQKVFWCSLKGSGWTRGVYSGNLSVENNTKIKAFETIKLYPNPTVSNCTISLNNEEVTTSVEISIYSLEGKNILNFKKPYFSNDSNTLEIPTAAIAPGVYILKVKTNTNEYIKRFIKK